MFLSAAALSPSTATTMTPSPSSISNLLAKSAFRFCTVMPSRLALAGSFGLISAPRRARATAVNSSGNAPVFTSISLASPSRIRPTFTVSPAFLYLNDRLSSSADLTCVPSMEVMMSASCSSEFSAGPPGTNCRTTTPSSTPLAKSRRSVSSRRVVILTPSQARVTLPSLINMSATRLARFTGTANPIPVFIPRMRVLMPMTSP